MHPAEIKAALRQTQLAALRETSVAQRARWSQQIVARILAHPAWQQARVVLLYAPLSNEPDLLALFGCGKRLIFSKVQAPTGLTLHEVERAELLVRTQGRLREPDADRCPEILVGEIDLALIPGLAFSAQSVIRLGRGGGYYDRLLAQTQFRAQKLGVCFQCQLLSTLPTESHDARMDEILTETAL